WNQYLRAIAEVHSVKPRLCDADDRHWITVQADDLADNILGAAESALPIAIAQNGNRIGAGDSGVLRGYESSGDSSSAKYIEIIARHQFAQHPLRLARMAHT